MQTCNRFWGGFTSLLLIFAVACSTKTVKKESVLDTPDNHYRLGMRLIERGDLAAAQQEFERASGLSPEYAEAYAGMALVSALRKDFKSAHKSADKALDKNGKNVEVRIIKGRIFTLERKGDKWLQKAEKEFKRAVKRDPESPKAYFYLGLAYKHGYDFPRAAEAFSKVIEMKGDFAALADKQWALMQKIQRAAPGTKIGMEIALIEKIDRADFAVLLLEEMKLAKVLEKKRPKTYDTSFKAPDDPRKMANAEPSVQTAATDIEQHWAKNWIEEILRIGGMEAFPDGTFRPDEKVMRSNYAQTMQQILIYASGDASLARKYVGENSRFPDVNSSNYAYNAIALMVDRGLLQAETVSGEFRPNATMSGADALLAIRKFQNVLRLEFK